MSDEQDPAASESQKVQVSVCPGGPSFKGNISDIPGVMLYDFCNAFPTLIHEWMWLVLHKLRIPKPLLKVIHACTPLLLAIRPA